MSQNCRLIIAILLISVSLTSCSFQIGETPQEPITALNDGSIKVIREDEGPEQGGVLNLFMTKPRTLNPLMTSSIYVKQLSAFIFDGLFKEHESGDISNILVKEYKFSQDGIILDMELKENIIFHDGTPLSAHDIAFTINTIKEAGEKSIYYNHIINIQNISALTSSRLRIVLNKADDSIISLLTFPIIPEHIFKDWPVEGHDDSRKLIGTGPFIFESFDDDSINLTRNDSWWRLNENDIDGSIWLDGVTFKIFPNESDLIQAFQRQQIDIAWLEDGEIESYSKRADIFFNKYVSNIMELLIMSPGTSNNSHLAKEGFRSIIVKYLRFYSSENTWEKGMMVSDTNKPSDMLNREETIEALEEIGFHYNDEKHYLYTNKNNHRNPVKLTLSYNALNTDRERISVCLEQAMGDIGITLQIKPTTYEELQQQSKNGRFDIMLIGCRIPLYSNQQETLEILGYNLNLSHVKDSIYPLYRKYGAVLYHNYIRGERAPVWNNIYNDWTKWYLVHTNQ